MRPSVMVLLSALMLTGTVQAAAQLRGPACAISAFVLDRDPVGLNVRAGPSTRSRVLRVIANEASAVAEIRGQSGAWFRVVRIYDAEDNATLFSGQGWVHNSLLGLAVANGNPRLYAAPASRSRVIARLIPDDSQVTLIGCSGDWARVRNDGREGWLPREGQCSSPLTTCV